MDIFVMNENFEVISIIDTYESLLWVDRYYEAGEFEIFAFASTYNIDILKPNYYISILPSNHLMIIDKVVVDTTFEDGDRLIITGKSLENILSRRIVWNQTSISGNLQNGIKKIIDDAIINPSITSRAISNFIFKNSTDTKITNLSIQETQYTGDNLYEVISTLCQVYKIGFRITLDDNFNFVFELYSGEDRSYSQDVNPYVVFSSKYENLVSSEYSTDYTDYMNVALVAGEGEGSERKTSTYGDASGLDRRELFVNAADISTVTESGEDIPESEYYNQLKQRGIEKLEEHKVVNKADGEIDINSMFVLHEDFDIGDVVQIIDDYGIEAKSRITEIVTSISASENTTYPTFTIEED